MLIVEGKVRRVGDLRAMRYLGTGELTRSAVVDKRTPRLGATVRARRPDKRQLVVLSAAARDVQSDVARSFL
jgi:hypothetical protein